MCVMRVYYSKTFIENFMHHIYSFLSRDTKKNSGALISLDWLYILMIVNYYNLKMVCSICVGEGDEGFELFDHQVATKGL